MRRIVAQEGVAGLYAGLDSAVFGISVTNFVYYYWYEWTRAAFQKRASAAGRGGAGRVASTIKLTTIESILAGALAGSATVIMTNPIWVVNTRMTTRAARAQSDVNTKDATLIEGEKKKLEEGEEEAAAAKAESKEEEKKPTGKKPTTISTLLALLRAEGPQALFRGVVPALVLVINPILQYTLFEQMKNLVEKRQRAATGQKTARITPTMAFLLGALGKLFATGVTYPYITVKSRMHVADAAAPGEGKKAEGVTGALGRVVREEGWGGLYKGEWMDFIFSPVKFLLLLLCGEKGIGC